MPLSRRERRLHLSPGQMPLSRRMSCRTLQDLLPSDVADHTIALTGSTRPETEPEWSVFDRQVIHGFTSYSSTAATAKTSNGKEVRVSIRFARPPLASYVELQTDDYLHGEPLVVAAHDDLLLVYMVVGHNGAHACYCPGDFLVYKSDLAWPWLKRLPTLGKQWFGRGKDTGVYRKGDDFYVASLQSLVRVGGEEVAELFCYSSITNNWKILNLECKEDPENGFYPICWSTDTVFSFGGFVWWADYHQGMVCCDITATQPELRFIRFPVDSWLNLEYGRGLPETYRNVAVVEGQVWFISVDDGRFRSEESSEIFRIEGIGASSISMYALTSDLKWTKQCDIGLRDLWSLPNYKSSPLPRSVPKFSIIDQQTKCVVHFILREFLHSAKHWIVTINLKDLSLGYMLYQNAIKEPNTGGVVDNMFLGRALLSTKLCQSLHIPM